MSFLKKLFGGGGGNSPSAAPEIHNGFSIYAEPVNDTGGWRISARIEKEIDGQLKSHRMIRADTLQGKDAAIEASLAKAKMLVDQQGEDIFD